MEQQAQQVVNRTAAWGVFVALVGVPLPEAILTGHVLVRHWFGLSTFAIYATACFISLAQLIGESIIFTRVGRRVGGPIGAWWQRSWLRRQWMEISSSVIHDLSGLRMILQPMFRGMSYLLLLAMSVNPLPVPLPLNPIGRTGGVVLWRSADLRGGGCVLALGSVIRLGIIYWSILTLMHR